MPLFHSKIVLIAALTLTFFCTHAQQKEKSTIGKISGRIIDSLTKQPIEYATISLINQETNKVIDGATTDNNGIFKIEGIPEGMYKMQFYFIGYKMLFKQSILLNKANSEVNLRNILLISMLQQLNEVNVTSEKNLIENKIDKLVYHADKDVTSQGGVASDILKKIPQVAVNADGTIELQGNSNIRFLINGKPSSVFGNNIADVLQSIPASQIQSIEVITSPGAKYDAEGSGGIINIILKKVTIQGINGNLSLTGGTRLENGSFNLAARKGKFGINTFISGNAQLTSTTINSSTRVTNGIFPSTLTQNGTSDFTRQGYQGGVSLDWNLNDNNSFTGGFTYNNFGSSNAGSTSRQLSLVDTSGNSFTNTSNLQQIDNSSANVYDWNFNYKKKFKKEGQELEFLYNSSKADNYSYYSQTQKAENNGAIYSSSYGKNPGSDMQSNFSLNYINPFGEKWIFETGAKTILYNINSRSDVFLLDSISDNYGLNTSQSNSVSYYRNIYSGYVSSTIKLKWFDIKLGLRDEYTETKADFSNAPNVHINPYNSIVPSGVISRTFKNANTLKLSYSYRIQRPDYRDLNPFVNASDPKNLSSGNPNLKPETTHNIELGYSKFFEKGINFNANLFYRGNRADIQSYTRYYPEYQLGDLMYNNIGLTMRENIGREDNFGLNIFASVSLKKKLSLRTNISAFQRYIYNSIDPGLDIQGFNYRINLNASYQITETFIAEVFGNFNSPRINAQGKMPSFTTYNLALRKQFYHKKMSLAFTTTNPFNKYVNQRTESKGTNFTINSLKQMPYRSFGINFTYKFGKLEFKQKTPEDINLTNPPVQN